MKEMGSKLRRKWTQKCEENELKSVKKMSSKV